MKLRVILFLVFASLSQIAVAGSIHTNMCLKNSRSTPIKLEVSGINNYDWDGDSRPDHVFQGKTIAAGGKLCGRLEVNSRALPSKSESDIDKRSKYPNFVLSEAGVQGSSADMVFGYSKSGQTSGNGRTIISKDPRWLVTGRSYGFIDTNGLQNSDARITNWKDLLVGASCSGMKCSKFVIR